MGGRPVLNEDLVNLPNWLVLKLRIEGDDAIALDNVELLEYRHEYDIRYALVSRTLRFRDLAGRETSLRSRRFVSMAHHHQAAIEWVITPENWSGRMEVVTAIDGRVTNRGVTRYAELEGRHLDPVSPRTFGPEVIALKVQTRQSNLYVAQAARTNVFRGDEPVDVQSSLFQTEDYIQQVVACDARSGEPVRVEKMVAFYTSRDRAISEPLGSAGESASRYPGFAEALERHKRAWDELWRACDMRLPGNDRVQLVLRFHISHVLQVCSRYTADRDAGVPARGLNGEAYRGHVFWDELYVYPFLNFRLPDITRALLMYRFRRLGQARAAARDAGYHGATYPWQSGSDGKEETQVVHLNPLSGQWEPDLSHNQRHVNAAIFYNIWSYYEATEDLDFLREYGAEMMLEIARFWASIATFNPNRDRYEIHGVMGPDEFHEKYPDAAEGGLRNNAYTNVMVAWIADTARKVLDLLPESRREALSDRLGLTDEEIAGWDEMSHKMFVPFHGDGIISQFEGYEGTRGAGLGRVPGEVRQDPAARPDPTLRGRRSRPIHAGQAGRHGHALLPVLRRTAAASVRTARLRVRARHRPQEHRLLRRADLAWLDAEFRHARRGPGRAGPRKLVGALHRGARERHRRRPRRHHPGGYPPRGDGGDARSDPARVRRHRHP